MVLSDNDIKFYNEQGYLLVEDVISKDQLDEMLSIVNNFYEKSKAIKNNDNIYDLEDGHSSTNPRLKQIKYKSSWWRCCSGMASRLGFLSSY